MLNKHTIPKIKAKIVCGAANNQLLDLHQDDLLLKERGIQYLPDFLVNRMGIVYCADEAYGYVGDHDELVERHYGTTFENSIYNMAFFVLKMANENNTTTQKVAIELAEKKMLEPHPIIGHRGLQIIQNLVLSPDYTSKLTH